LPAAGQAHANALTVCRHQIDPALLVVRYEREIKELKQELSMLNTLANRGAVSYEDYTPEESFEIQQTVQRYVHGDIDLNDLQVSINSCTSDTY